MEKRYAADGTVAVSAPAYTATILATVGLVSFSVHLATLFGRNIVRRLPPSASSPLQLLRAELVTSLGLTTPGMALLLVVTRLVYGLRVSGDYAVLALSYTISAATLSVLLITSQWASISSAPTAGRHGPDRRHGLPYPMISLTGAAMTRELLLERVQEIARFLITRPGCPPPPHDLGRRPNPGPYH